MAIKAWDLMGGFNWLALPAIVELLGVHDVETLIYHLKLIRDQNVV